MRHGRQVSIGWLLAASILLGAPASRGRAAERSDARAQLVFQALRDGDLRVAAISFRLATANLELCADRRPLSGIVLHDASRYEPAMRAAAMRYFGLADRSAVELVAPGSPAARYGIAADDEILFIDGAATPPIDLAAAKASYAATEQVERQLATALDGGAATLQLRRAGAVRTLRLTPEWGCAGTAQLQTGGKFNAWSDGADVVVMSRVLDFTRSDDELASVIAHEMAHVLLRHRDRLRAAGVPRGLFGRIGASARRVRETETEADRWGVYLAARAGYAPDAAADFWERFGAVRGDGPFDDATHPPWRERARALRQAAAEVAALRAAGKPLVPPA